MKRVEHHSPGVPSRMFSGKALARILVLAALGGCEESTNAPDATAQDAAIEDAAIEDAAIEDAAIADGGLGRFEPIADLAEGPRQETAVVTLGGEVFVLGGYDENQ